MKTGKAVYRALCGNFQVQFALVSNLVLAVAPHKRIGSELEETTDISDYTNVSTDSVMTCMKVKPYVEEIKHY